MNRRNFLKRAGLGAAGVAGAVLMPGVLRDEPLDEVSAVSQSVVSNTPDVASTTSSDTGTGTWRWDHINAMTRGELSFADAQAQLDRIDEALKARRRQFEEATRIVDRLTGRRV